MAAADGSDGVTFIDVPCSYYTEENMTIRYAIGENLSLRDSKIHLLPIGWKDVSETVVAVDAKGVKWSKGSPHRKVTLPSDLFCDIVLEGACYELCCVDSCGKVIGSSCPFSFSSEETEDASESSLDHSMEAAAGHFPTLSEKPLVEIVTKLTSDIQSLQTQFQAMEEKLKIAEDELT